MALLTQDFGEHTDSGAPLAGYAYDSASHTVLYLAIMRPEAAANIVARLRNTSTGQTFTVPTSDGSMIVAVTGLTVDAGGGPGNFTASSETVS